MGSEPPSFARFSSADKHLVAIRHPRRRPAATCFSRHFATPPRPRTTFRWAATAQAASLMVGETACAASCASPASRRPRDGVENRHFFAPRHRRNGLQDRRKLRGKVRISLLWRFRRPQGTYWRQHRPYLKYFYSATPPCAIWLSGLNDSDCFSNLADSAELGSKALESVPRRANYSRWTGLVRL